VYHWKRKRIGIGIVLFGLGLCPRLRMRLWIFQSAGGGIGQWVDVGVVVGGVRGLRFLVVVVPAVVVDMVAAVIAIVTADSVVLVVVVVRDYSCNS